MNRLNGKTIALVAGVLLATGLLWNRRRESLKSVAEAIRPGDDFVETRARLDATGARYWPHSRDPEHLWTQMLWRQFLVGHCYVSVDASGKITKATYKIEVPV